MTATSTPLNAAASGTFTLGGDLTVNRLGFGAMRLTGKGIWGEPKDANEAKAVLRRAVELGVNFIDTADAYGPDVSERLIGEALYPYPQGLIIATKGGLLRGGPDNWYPNGHPQHLREAIDASLKRLRLERIDLYQFHRPDPDVPFEESVGALADLQKEGKIRHVGLSNVDVEQLNKARAIVSIVSVQNRYNTTDRGSEGVLNECAREGIGFIPWAPIGGGPETREGGALDQIAKRHNATQQQIALAWLLQRSPVMLPIPGTSSVTHLEENIAAAAIKLSNEDVTSLDS
jgi:pyridoxine 4-dehydrogenase